MTAEEILDQYEQARPFYKKGGITVSGGEPLMQIGFVTELFEKAKKSGIHTCLDTSGITFNPGSQAVMAHFDRLLASTDLILLDIKHIDPKEHVKLCAQPQDNILAFAAYLEKKQIPVWIRHVVVPGITDREEYLYRLGRYLGTLEKRKGAGCSAISLTWEKLSTASLESPTVRRHSPLASCKGGRVPQKLFFRECAMKGSIAPKFIQYSLV